MVDKAVLIAGGTAGIGAEISARLASEGARVVIADVNVAQAPAKAASMVAQQGQAIGVASHITHPELCEPTARAAVDRFGQLNGVVNRAGMDSSSEQIRLRGSCEVR